MTTLIIIAIVALLIFGFRYAKKDRYEMQDKYLKALEAGQRKKAIYYGRKFYQAKYKFDQNMDEATEAAITNDLKAHGM